MARKRLRPILDEVITDADLVASARIVAGFPPPPWETAPPAPAERNGHTAPPPEAAAAVPAFEPVDRVEAEPEPPALVPVVPVAAVVATAAAVVLPGHADTAAHATRRRRRSASLLPPLPSPTDIPEDAPGRVAILAMGPPPGTEHEAPAPEPSSPPVAAPAPVTPVGGAAPLAGWLPVLTLGVALVLVFVVGVLVTR
jgi:hypothetical protein